MSGVGKAIAAGLAGAAIGGLGAYADKKAADKAKAPSAPSYSIAHKMRQDSSNPSSSASSPASSGADTQTPDTE